MLAAKYFLLALPVASALQDSIYPPSSQCLLQPITLFGDVSCSPTGASYYSSGPRSSASVTPHDKVQVNHRRPREGHQWSHKRVCTGFLEKLKSELCVYTDEDFAGGRGISLFTLPRIADELSKSRLFRDPDALNEMVKHGNLMFSASDMPEIGFRVLAQGPQKRGEVVTANVPILIGTHENELSWQEREELLRVAVLQLPVFTQKLVDKLSGDLGGPHLLLTSIMAANAGFSMVHGGRKHFALFPELAIINHSCAPNAVLHIDPKTLVASILATRKIKSGEEVNYSYTRRSPNICFLPWADRQRTIMELAQFECYCSRCLKGPDADVGLSEITRLERALSEWQPGTGVDDAFKLVRLYQEEGLDGFLDTAYAHVALAYNSLGNAQRAKEYAKLTIDAMILADAITPSQRKMWKEFMDRPQEHWSWQRRMTNA